ncbi:alkene reductase [Nannocystis sp. SCPEA4]|uniref:alkene reductase n=1 Tax=Nannocystis sp. SCPEA4 TaxID=2996787 RepID=UPI0022714989|nr:alkene reductase [Nannocystis sp. SCPEA4]MCY1055778.1 alkene reductase [Nannocystis sp. SCPEA4]
MGDLLHTPTTLGDLELKNRVVMAPMTRNRALGNVPNDLMATYYGQRSEAGLIVTEGTAPAPDGLGYARIPGLFNGEHVQGWRGVTEAVHAAGGRIFVQLMHTGRIGHALNLPPGARVLGPSAIAAKGDMYTDQQGPQPFPVPHEMSEADIAQAIEGFADSAGLAREAGFDGVELHGANGYLIDQFLNVASNQRRDDWGGSVENRARFALEVARKVASRIGAGRVGIRISPYGVFNSMAPDPELDAVYLHLARGLSELGLAYVHLVDFGGKVVPADLQAGIRAAFNRGRLILSGEYDAARAEADLAAGRGDLVAFGRPFIANPRLVSRLRAGLPLAAGDPTTFYTPGARGYTDYPLE